MSDFWVDFLLAASGFLLILVVVYVPVVKGRIVAIRHQRQKIAEYEDRLKKAGSVVLGLENEVAKKDKLISDLIMERIELRRELKKRTDQYNDLVDLAMEKGIIE